MRLIFLALILGFTFSSCHYQNGRRVKGNGNFITSDRNVSGFTAVKTTGSIDIVVSKGDYKVSVKGDENLLKYVITEVVEGTLKVRLQNNFSFSNMGNITVYVTAPAINQFESSGSGNITGEGVMKDAGKIKVKIFGSGDVKLELDCPEVESAIHGSGVITLGGETRDLSCEIMGSGDIKASNLKAENVKATIHGSGNAEVYASASLNASISASGDIRYRGEPKVSSNINGSGSVSQMH